MSDESLVAGGFIFMGQTVLVLLVLLIVAIYLVRHYLRVYRAEDPACGGCAGCCPATGSEIRGPVTKGAAFKDRSCADNTAQDCESQVRAGKPAPQGSSCQDMKTRDHEVCH